MKPDWKDAPEWANWLAMDIDGGWYWYEDRPSRGREAWYALGKIHRALAVIPSWADSLSERPETTKPAEAGPEGQGA